MRPIEAQDTTEQYARPRILLKNNGLRSPGEGFSASHRLTAVVGLRAYLALWVLVCHAMWSSGYRLDTLSGLPRLFSRGAYAVDIFIIISGFVIFLSLDQQRETYKQFIARRFFRLFPAFIVLFVVAIPLSRLSEWNITHSTQYLTPQQIEDLTGRIGAWWQDLHWNIPLHLFMIQGVIPNVLIYDAPAAFLVAAWSVSLEWQFYLIAPMAYALAVSSRPFVRPGLCALCLLLFEAARHGLPTVEYGAALPFHVEFFFLGAVSYFLYKRYSAHRLSDASFPVACSIAIFFFVLSGESVSLIPVGFWIVFLGLILEHPSSFSWRLASPLFTNPLVQYLGRISYSMYLSHMLVIIVIQHALLTLAPHLSRMAHFGVLLAGSTTATIAVSAVLYKFVEAPGIEAGRTLAVRLSGWQAAGKSNGMIYLRPYGRIKPWRMA